MHLCEICTLQPLLLILSRRTQSPCCPIKCLWSGEFIPSLINGLWGEGAGRWSKVLRILFWRGSLDFLCFVCGVFSVKGYAAYVTGFSTSCSSPSLPSPPIPPSLLTPLCPFGLDNTQALYATCPSARLYLREPQPLSLELPLLGFWPCPPPPPPPFSLSHSSLFPFAPRCPLQIQTRTAIASVSYFIHLKTAGHQLSPSVLWSGC